MKHALLLAAALAAGSLAPAAHAQSTFPDVPDNHWAAAAIKRLAEAGIIEGYPVAPGQNNAPRPIAQAPEAAPAPAAPKAIARHADRAARRTAQAARAPQRTASRVVAHTPHSN